MNSDAMTEDQNKEEVSLLKTLRILNQEKVKRSRENNRHRSVWKTLRKQMTSHKKVKVMKNLRELVPNPKVSKFLSKIRFQRKLWKILRYIERTFLIWMIKWFLAKLKQNGLFLKVDRHARISLNPLKKWKEVQTQTKILMMKVKFK